MVFSCPGAAFRAVPGTHNRSCRSNSSSSRKKQPKSSFSIGFRSYVRDFLGAIFMLFRPSVPWCFPVREPLENNPFSHRRTNKLDTCSIVDFDAWLQSGRQRARGRIACIGMAYLLRASAWCIPCTRDTYPVSIELW